MSTEIAYLRAELDEARANLERAYEIIDTLRLALIRSRTRDRAGAPAPGMLGELAVVQLEAPQRQGGHVICQGEIDGKQGSISTFLQGGDRLLAATVNGRMVAVSGTQLLRIAGGGKSAPSSGHDPVERTAIDLAVSNDERWAFMTEARRDMHRRMASQLIEVERILMMNTEVPSRLSGLVDNGDRGEA